MTANFYFSLRAWMVKQLKLTGTPLVLYTVIYSRWRTFNEATSAYYMKDFVAGDENLLQKGIDFLIQRKLIREEEVVSPKGYKNKAYTVIESTLDDFDVKKEYR